MIVLLRFIQKNFRIIFRNPFTVVLVLLMPIILMLLIGLTYGGSLSYNNVKIGVINSEADFFESLDDFEYVFFQNKIENIATEACLEELEKGSVEVCISLPAEFSLEKVSKEKNITFYIDNTRPQLSNQLVSYFDFILKNHIEQASTVQVHSILKKIQGSINFVNASKDTFKTDLINENRRIISNLEELNATLNILQKEIENSYFEYVVLEKESQLFLLELNESINESVKTLESQKFELNELGEGLKEISELQTEFLNSLNSYAQNDENFRTSVDLTPFENSIQSIRSIEEGTEDSEETLEEEIKLLKSKEIPTLSPLDSFNEFNESLGTLLFKTQILLEEYKEKKDLPFQDFEEIDKQLFQFEEISQTNPSEVINPFVINHINVHETESNIELLFSIILVVILLFNGVLLTNIISSMEMNSPGFTRNLISPKNKYLPFFSLFLTSFLIILLQTIILVCFMEFFFDSISFFDSFFPFFIKLILLISLFVFIGKIISYSFSSSQISLLVSTFIVLSFFLLSNIILPLELMPLFFSHVLTINPVVLGEKILREQLFFGVRTLWTIDLLFVYQYFLFFLSLSFYFYRRRIESILEK